MSKQLKIKLFDPVGVVENEMEVLKHHKIILFDEEDVPLFTIDTERDPSDDKITDIHLVEMIKLKK